MTTPYYAAEHFEAYARIRAQGLDQWNDLHEPPAGYEHFPSRSFLERALPGNDQRVLVYGCGTGGSACFLAARGYRVEAVDLVPDAIELARERARRLGLTITFEVADVCAWGPAGEAYDVVVDDFCLQSIVTDADRAALFAAVRDRLLPAGRYLIATAMWQPDRDYGDDHFDPATGIVRTPCEGTGPDTTMINGRSYRPDRRHLTPDQLRAELLRNGFEVIDQGGPNGGQISCRPIPR